MGPWVQFRFPSGFEWNRATLPIPHIPHSFAGMRIVHLSDLHLGRGWGECYDQLIERINSAIPDLILITGDIVEDKFDHRKALPTAKRILTSLKSRYGAFSVLGNHDSDLLLPRFQDWGVTALHRKTIILDLPVGRLRLVGLPGVSPHDYEHELQAEKQRETGANAGIRSANAKPHRDDELRIVLSHYPVHVRKVGHLAPHVFLAGHTHGGQVCLPGGVAIITHSKLERPYHRGIHRINDTWLVVNRGFGFATLPIRLFCPAEVIHLEIRPASSE